jgi:hypothetical protein
MEVVVWWLQHIQSGQSCVGVPFMLVGCYYLPVEIANFPGDLNLQQYRLAALKFRVW